MRISFLLVALTAVISVVHVAGQRHKLSVALDQKDASDGEVDADNDALADNQQRRILKSTFDIDPRTIIQKSNQGDYTYENLRLLGGGLRFDWTNMRNYKDMTLLAKVIDYYQNPKDACRRPVRSDIRLQRLSMPGSGLGSSLHLWARHLCHAYDRKEVLVVEPANTGNSWVWNDKRYCGGQDPPLSCYFGNHESLRACEFSDEEWDKMKLGIPVETAFKTSWNYYDSVNGCSFIDRNFESLQRSDTIDLPPGITITEYNRHIIDDHRPFLQKWNAAAMEYLFQSVNPIVVLEAHRQLLMIFDRGIVPSNLVTVHIRWGDKYKEVEDLAGIDEYITATRNIIGDGWDTEPQHIYLATEDPLAIKEFQDNMPLNWTIYISGPTFKDARNTGPFGAAFDNEGQDGLESLAALLISLEANKYVLTTESNWSRLINELRKNIVDRRCGGCTEMFDVRPGEW